MLENGELDLNGKFFCTELEEGYGGLGCMKSSLRKGLAVHQEMRR